MIVRLRKNLAKPATSARRNCSRLRKTCAICARCLKRTHANLVATALWAVASGREVQRLTEPWLQKLPNAVDCAQVDMVRPAAHQLFAHQAHWIIFSRRH